MTGEFKQCPNGHYYQGLNCPYCKTDNNNTSMKTDVFTGGSNSNSQIPTKIQNGAGSGIKTTIIDGPETVVSNPKKSAQPANHTVFGDETEFVETSTGQQVEKKVYRSTRKLVGWLVTYSFDAMGVDYKLYEGRNIIGRDMDCNITINDSTMSGKHATLLFRDGKYALKDEMSSHSTFVNDENISFETYILKDGDIIRMGETFFMIRFSLFERGVKTYDSQEIATERNNPKPSEYKQCSNGHHYQGTSCPFCANNNLTLNETQTIT